MKLCGFILKVNTYLNNVNFGTGYLSICNLKKDQQNVKSAFDFSETLKISCTENYCF